MKGRVFKNQETLFLNATFLETKTRPLGKPECTGKPVDSLSLRPRLQGDEPSLFFLAPRKRLKNYLVFVGADEM
jgi:hypothetical protein